MEGNSTRTEPEDPGEMYLEIYHCNIYIYTSHRVQVPPEDGLGGESTSREWSWGVKGHPQDGPGPLGHIFSIFELFHILIVTIMVNPSTGSSNHVQKACQTSSIKPAKLGRLYAVGRCTYLSDYPWDWHNIYIYILYMPTFLPGSTTPIVPMWVNWPVPWMVWVHH